VGSFDYEVWDKNRCCFGARAGDGGSGIRRKQQLRRLVGRKLGRIELDKFVFAWWFVTRRINNKFFVARWIDRRFVLWWFNRRFFVTRRINRRLVLRRIIARRQLTRRFVLR
jgi:hypothetical protein